MGDPSPSCTTPLEAQSSKNIQKKLFSLYSIAVQFNATLAIFVNYARLNSVSFSLISFLWFGKNEAPCDVVTRKAGE